MITTHQLGPKISSDWRSCKVPVRTIFTSVPGLTEKFDIDDYERLLFQFKFKSNSDNLIFRLLFQDVNNRYLGCSSVYNVGANPILFDDDLTHPFVSTSLLLSNEIGSAKVSLFTYNAPLYGSCKINLYKK